MTNVQRRGRRTTVLLTAIAGALVLAACSSSGSGGAGASNSGAPPPSPTASGAAEATSTTASLLGMSTTQALAAAYKGTFGTPPASGSFRHDGMVIVPCSMGTAGRIANGISDDLVTRSADVCLKEGRKLILVPREMPWNLIMLRNLTHLAEAGATILPACPAWYHRPATLEDLADTVVARILQNLGVEQNIVPQWQEGG